MRTILLLCLAACGSKSPVNPGETCTQASCPHGGHTYKFCAQGGACRYVGSDNSSFECTSCADCTTAANQIANWCATGGTNGSTTAGTNGSITGTNGSTTGTNGSITGTNGSTTGTNGSTTGTNGSTTGGPPSCDVGSQNCGSGQKCVAHNDGTNNIVGQCVANGTVAQGQPCTSQMSTDTILDNCQAGLICDNLFGNFPMVCRKICTTDSNCAAGEKCGDFLFAGLGWGWCAPTCTPFSTATGNCASGMDCGETVDSVVQGASETGFFLCKKTGTGAAYASCTTDANCGVNLWCGIVDQTTMAGGCLPNCDSSHACTLPNADMGTATCHALATQPNGAGYCTTP
jgi:hypothetical protein